MQHWSLDKLRPGIVPSVEVVVVLDVAIVVVVARAEEYAQVELGQRWRRVCTLSTRRPYKARARTFERARSHIACTHAMLYTYSLNKSQKRCS